MTKIWNLLDEWMVREDEVPSHRWPNLFPSEASVVIKSSRGKEVQGTCARKAWLRYQSSVVANMMDTGDEQEPEGLLSSLPRAKRDPTSEWIFEERRRIEDTILGVMTKAGLYYSGHRKFLVDLPSGLKLSGEIDAVIQVNGELVGVEIKSVSGYNAESEIFGTPALRRLGKKGRPRDSHLLQTGLYAWKYRDSLPSFCLLYFLRGKSLRCEFEIRVQEARDDWTILIDGRPSEVTINMILDRYRELAEHIKTNTLPPRDYSLVYNDKTMNERLSGEDSLPKGIAEAWQKYYERCPKNPGEKWKGRQLKRPSYGDLECSWCEYRDWCYDHDGNPQH